MSDQSFRKREVIMAGAIFVLALFFGPYLYYSFSVYVKGRANKPYPEYEWGEMNQLWITCITVTIQIFLRPVITDFFYPIVLPHVKDQNNEQNKAKRAEKASKYIYQSIKYSFLTTYGYYVLRDSEWLPWYLGGTQGKYENIWNNVPFGITVEGATTYAFVELGFFLGEFVNLIFIQERQNDFVEMLLHHACAFLLILSMIAANTFPMGCVILFLHDIADIPVALVKCSTQFKKWWSLPADMLFYVLMVTSWFWTRCLVLPFFTFYMLTEVEYQDPVWKPYNFVLTMSGVLLAFLCALHYYWITLML